MDPAQSSRLITNCPLCHSEYRNEQVQLVGQRGTARLFHCTCGDCGSAMLAIIMETKGSVSSVGLMTDLEAQDAIRVQDVPAISSDDCIRAHRMFEHDSATFVDMILGRAGSRFL